MGTVAVFRSSPRKHGNTNTLTDIVTARLRQEGLVVREFDLHGMDIRPCTACRACQEDWSTVSCSQNDDMQEIFRAVSESELLILATPIYSWQCTPPMKAVLDRLVYAMNMYYGEERGPSLWEGKRVALITTSGYPREQGPDLLEEGIRRYCKHSRLSYEGMLWGRHMGYAKEFLDEEKQTEAVAFAERLCAPERVCPVCGKYVFEEEGAYEICPVCGWEDDPVQKRDPDLAGGANSRSLNEARKEYYENDH